MDRQPRLTATNLKDVIDAQGRRKRWLADRLGVSESLVGKIALGQRTIGVEMANKIAMILGVPVDVLFTLHEQSISSSREEGRAA